MAPEIIDDEMTRRPDAEEGVEISVVIPAYNELMRLPPSLKTIIEFLSSNYLHWEIIVSDDGSTDGSVMQLGPQFPQVRFLRAPNDQNMGKGAAVRRGMVVARGERVLFSDADLSTPIDEVAGMIEAMRDGKYDVVIASRDLADSKLEVRQAWYRELAGRIFNLAVRMISGLPFKDTQCGFKLFTRRAARDVFSVARSDGFAFDVEALMIARAHGLKILEHPVRWINAEGSKVHFLTDGPKMLMNVIGFRMAQIKGHYKLKAQD